MRPRLRPSRAALLAAVAAALAFAGFADAKSFSLPQAEVSVQVASDGRLLVTRESRTRSADRSVVAIARSHCGAARESTGSACGRTGVHTDRAVVPSSAVTTQQGRSALRSSRDRRGSSGTTRRQTSSGRSRCGTASQASRLPTTTSSTSTSRSGAPNGKSRSGASRRARRHRARSFAPGGTRCTSAATLRLPASACSFAP